MTQPLTGAQFAHAFGLRAHQFAWFLGAGASAGAGIPTGYAMIQDFKKRLFCQLAGISQREVDSNDPMWVDRISQLLNARVDLPPPGDPQEYAAAFEAVYASPEDRRAYIEEAVRKGTPSFAHRVLASLLVFRRVPCVFTTNFDQLVEAATTVADQLMPPEDRVHLTVAAIDSAERAELCVRESRWPLLAKLHGDFQSVQLKNTTDELRTQDSLMRSVLTRVCGRFGLVVIGYSGRDESVMQALTDALKQPGAFPGGIFWVAQSARSVLPAVQAFLGAASDAGISARLVESLTFDELAGDLVDSVDLPPVLLRHVQESQPLPVLREVSLPVQERRRFPVLQCSAIPVTSMPTAARQIEVDDPITSLRARELVREVGIKAVVASNGRAIAAFGADEDLLRAFSCVGGRLAGTIELHPDKDSWAKGLLYDALTRAMCRHQPLLPHLRRRGHSIIVARTLPTDTQERSVWRKQRLSRLASAYSAALVGEVPGCNYPFSEGVKIRLEQVAGRWWCVFEPFTDVQRPRAASDQDEMDTSLPGRSVLPVRLSDQVVDWQRERWAKRYNPLWSQIISAWAAILAGSNRDSIEAIGLGEKKGLDAVFRLSPVTGWSRPAHEHDYFSRSGR